MRSCARGVFDRPGRRAVRATLSNGRDSPAAHPAVTAVDAAGPPGKLRGCDRPYRAHSKSGPARRSRTFGRRRAGSDEKTKTRFREIGEKIRAFVSRRGVSIPRRAAAHARAEKIAIKFFDTRREAASLASRAAPRECLRTFCVDFSGTEEMRPLEFLLLRREHGKTTLVKRGGKE